MSDGNRCTQKQSFIILLSSSWAQLSGPGRSCSLDGASTSAGANPGRRPGPPTANPGLHQVSAGALIFLNFLLVHGLQYLYIGLALLQVSGLDPTDISIGSFKKAVGNKL